MGFQLRGYCGETILGMFIRQIQRAYMPGGEDEGEILGVLSAIRKLSFAATWMNSRKFVHVDLIAVRLPPLIGLRTPRNAAMASRYLGLTTKCSRVARRTCSRTRT